MRTPDTATGSVALTREDQAREELGHTHFSRGVRSLLIGAFLLTLLVVPAFETIRDISLNIRAREDMRTAGVDRSQWPRRRPQVLDVLDLLPFSGAPDGWFGLVPTAAQIRAYEDSLALHSPAGRAITPRMQWLLTRWLGVGSEKVIVGRDGWLFYADGVKHVTGPPFLDAAVLRRRAISGAQPDPRLAIVQFRDILQSVGVKLVVLPMPDKTSIHPDPLSPSGGEMPRQNPSWDAFVNELRGDGISVVDVGAQMVAADRTGTPQFLRTDSHWSPEGVDVVAGLLASEIRSDLGAATEHRYVRRILNTAHDGDLVKLLDLPSTRVVQLFRPEPVALRQVMSTSGERWQPDAGSEVLVIGDSFTEMYSLRTMGEQYAEAAAGLAEQLCFYLRQPTDRMASHHWTLNGRDALGTTATQVKQHAAGRRVVVWEFAARRLTLDDWPLLPE